MRPVPRAACRCVSSVSRPRAWRRGSTLGAFGRSWSHNFEYRLTQIDADNVIVDVPGGFQRGFSRDGNGNWSGDAGDAARLFDYGDGTFGVREKDGLLRDFDLLGRLSKVAEPNGEPGRSALLRRGG